MGAGHRIKISFFGISKKGFRYFAVFEVDLNQRVKDELSVYYDESDGD